MKQSSRQQRMGCVCAQAFSGAIGSVHRKQQTPLTPDLRLRPSSTISSPECRWVKEAVPRFPSFPRTCGQLHCRGPTDYDSFSMHQSPRWTQQQDQDFFRFLVSLIFLFYTYFVQMELTFAINSVCCCSGNPTTNTSIHHYGYNIARPGYVLGLSSATVMTWQDFKH